MTSGVEKKPTPKFWIHGEGKKIAPHTEFQKQITAHLYTSTYMNSKISVCTTYAPYRYICTMHIFRALISLQEALPIPRTSPFSSEGYPLRGREVAGNQMEIIVVQAAIRDVRYLYREGTINNETYRLELIHS